MEFAHAYDDKNIYSRLWPNMKQPTTILKNMGGRYFVPDPGTFSGERELTENEAVDVLFQSKAGVIKPSMMGGGAGVEVFEFGTIEPYAIAGILHKYSTDFIIQDVVKNHKSLKCFNPTSLNTCRIFTYRSVKNDNYVFLGAVIRFGGLGDFRDNASAGGGFCRVNENGVVGDTIFKYGSFEKRSLNKDKGLVNVSIPKFDEMIKCCRQLHNGLPYNDLVGWDVTLDETGDIVLIEYNYAPDIELLQMSEGPAFGDYTDEIMEKLTQPTTEDMIAVRRSFAAAPNKSMVIDMKKVGDL